MKLITFVMAVQNGSSVAVCSQKFIYENVLKYFDVIDAIMCLNGDCLAVCRSVATSTDEPAAFLDFVKKNDAAKTPMLQIVDRHEHVELLLDRMYNIVEMFNNQ
ncbi:ORF47 [Spodoptera exigua multiple nucleopolyhedrovirus]|uniref:ORF47 n=1 Tax=Spodoptera exigua nuclear polyhedrosis virus (strain US) TaxID=31506 RepID=Q9J888_NPVSE|nr:ORF47 [Spodoptera exigua multiple nucleopolyhedrovirus]AAF33577.1 ORF47 [Spodoptera exigua multiple nucleopolyhedrovirus]